MITSEHSDKPNFMQMVTDTTSPFTELQALTAGMPSLFEIDTAVGQQLDVIGELVGVSRQVLQPITDVYFAFNTDGLGFNQGIWKGPYDPDTGLVSLPDDFYRLLIRSRIVNNSWDGSKATVYQIIDTVFAGSGFDYIIQDNADMTITLALLGPTEPPALLTALFAGGYLDIKPAGISISARYAQAGPLFAFNLESELFAGFNVGNWPVSI